MVREVREIERRRGRGGEGDRERERGRRGERERERERKKLRERLRERARKNEGGAARPGSTARKETSFQLRHNVSYEQTVGGESESFFVRGPLVGEYSVQRASIPIVMSGWVGSQMMGNVILWQSQRTLPTTADVIYATTYAFLVPRIRLYLRLYVRH